MISHGTRGLQELRELDVSSDSPEAQQREMDPFRLVGAIPAGGRELHLGKPKGLLDAGDGTFLERAVTGLRSLGADSILVGVDEPRGPLTSRVAAAGARSIQVPAGPGACFLSLALGSLIETAGLPEEGVPPEPESAEQLHPPTVLLWLPVDLPLVQLDTLKQLVAALEVGLGQDGHGESQEPGGGGPSLPGELVRPTYGNRPGEVMAIVLSGRAPAPCSDPWTLPLEEWLHAGVPLREVAVDDPGIHKRIRTMADYRRHFPRVFRRRFQKW